MKLKHADWEPILSKAAKEARSAVRALGPEGRDYIGTGASGDRTLMADKAAEDAIIDSLKEVEGLRFLSEETGEVGDAKAQFVAVVDPLDGSSNFARGIPVYCTSIAVAEGDSLTSTVAAHILDMTTGDEYFASRGGGAKKNGKGVRSSSSTNLRMSVTGLDLSGLREDRVKDAMKVVAATRRQVHLGANALELAMLSAGTLDCFVDIRGKMRVTDIAAGLLMLKEAGGVYSLEDCSSGDPHLSLGERVSVLASGNTALHGSLLKALGRA